jgi:glycosyltransferase involved in cell wall biosynthesis
VKSNSNLLVFNFVMDPQDPLLSHQYEAVLALANDFNKITVITGRVGEIESSPRIQIISTNWKPGHGLRNLYQLFVKAIPEIIRGDFKSVFYHMTDLQSALLSPLVRLRRRQQFLWYAHTFKSKYLVFASWWVTGIVTSTSGSCPLTGKSVRPIGQAINQEKFMPISFDKFNFDKLIHIGRFDKSKNIDYLIATAEELKRFFPDIELTIIGSPGNQESRNWAKDLIAKCKPRIESGWLHFKDAIPRDQFPIEIAENGCFFHGYLGSLDKTLIESTMLRVPVVTLNPEYISIFGTWAKLPISDLKDEYQAFRTLTAEEINRELARRLDLARRHHSLQNWIEQLATLLK